MKFNKKYILVLVAVLLVLGDGSVWADNAAVSAPAKPNISANLEEQGKQLRVAIDKAYTEARAIDTKSGDDITSVVTLYIPLGTSFDDAEKILYSAGFKVGRRPTPEIGDKEIRFEVASIDPYPTSFFFGKITVDVFLTPLSPTDFTKVSKISAFIGADYP